MFDPLDMMISGPQIDIEAIDKQVQMAFPCYVKNDQSWNEIEILWDEFHELYENKKWAKVLEVTDKIIQIKPDDQYAYMYKAYALDELKQYEEAIRCLDASLDIDDKFARAMHIKGIVLNNLERYDEAITFFDKALEVDPEYKKSLFNKGRSLLYLKQYNKAIQYYNKVLKIDSEDNYALNNKALALTNLKKYGDSVVWRLIQNIKNHYLTKEDHYCILNNTIKLYNITIKY